MAKGNSSSNSLKRIVHEVQQFVLGWSAVNLRKNNAAGAVSWPAPYQLAAIRGEAVLRRQFFDSFIPRLPYQADAAQQIALWQTLVEDDGIIVDYVNRVGIKSALKRETALPEHTHGEARILFCILLEALTQDNPALLVIAVDQLFLHYWKHDLYRKLRPLRPAQKSRPRRSFVSN